jgi:hypothetical protein
MLQFMFCNRHNEEQDYEHNSLSISSEQSTVKAAIFLCNTNEDLLMKAMCTEIWRRSEESSGYLQDQMASRCNASTPAYFKCEDVCRMFL